MKIQIIEKESKFEDNDYVEETEETTYEVFEELPELAEKEENEEKRDFVFIDGVIDELPIKISFTYEGEEFISDIFISSVGCGFENGKMISPKIKLYITFQKDVIKSIVEENIKPKLEKITEKTVDMVFIYDQRIKRKIILDKLRTDEFTLANNIIKDIGSKVFVLDGNLRLEESFKNIYENYVVGIVKNFSWPEEFIKNIEKHRFSEIRSKLIFTEKKGKKRFSFFLWLKKSSIVRVDFFRDSNQTVFANFLARRISGWAQNIGDRAPKNITPIRILEKRLRDIIGNKTFYIRDIKRNILNI